MQLNLSIILGMALADSIKPTVFAVLITLLTSLKSKSNTKLFLSGISFIGSFFTTSLIVGLYFLPAFTYLSKASRIPYVLIGIYTLLLGILELIKHFRPKKKYLSKSIFDPYNRIKSYKKALLNSNIPSSLLGIIVAFLELPLSGAIYIATLSTYTTSMPAEYTFILLAAYNMILLIPLVIITLSVSRGISTKPYHLWQRSHHNQIHLGISSILIVFGIWLITFA